MDKDLEDIVKWARSQAWDVRTTDDGYVRFYTPAGQYAAQYPATPGRAYRRMKDLKTALRRNGLQVPPPSKKEQRSMRRRPEGGQR
jgi:hypothetical protein